MAQSPAVTEARRAFVPGMGVEWLLPLYDPLTRLLGLNRFRRDLLVQAGLEPSHRLLDVGCGTGSLVVLAKRLFPSTEVTGVDPDPQALARAARKARREGVAIQFDRGFSDALPYPDASFDRVVSSFMFHHLDRHEKEGTAREILRVLKPGGEFHLLDFGGPDSTGGRRSRGLHGHHRLADNDARTILGIFEGVGLADAATTSGRTALGLIRIAGYRARRPH